MLDFYYAPLAAAYVRGRLAGAPYPVRSQAPLFEKPLEQLAPAELEQLLALGLEAGLRLHRFKRTMGLARVKRVLGVLKGLEFGALLDIGSGRGTFLWPLLDAFPGLPVTAIDRDAQRVADLRAMRAGGMAGLTAVQMDATALAFSDASFEVVTMLEVLEHIPEAQRALAEVVRVAGRFVVLSVPSREDTNPEHIHLFSQKALRGMFEQAGGRSVRFEYVPNHLIAVARVGD